MTKWALMNFLAWQKSRNERFKGDEAKQVPLTLLESTDPSVLAKWLALYCAETRKQDGEEYPPKTIYALLTGILRHKRSLNQDCPTSLISLTHGFQPCRTHWTMCFVIFAHVELDQRAKMLRYLQRKMRNASGPVIHCPLIRPKVFYVQFSSLMEITFASVVGSSIDS